MATLFRVHFTTGQFHLHQDVTAENPKAAKTAVEAKHPDALVLKIKVVKGD